MRFVETKLELVHFALNFILHVVDVFVEIIEKFLDSKNVLVPIPVVGQFLELEVRIIQLIQLVTLRLVIIDKEFSARGLVFELK